MTPSALTLVTAPDQEPVSLEEALAFLRVSNREEATLVQGLITLAREEVEKYTGRALFTQTWRHVQPNWPTGPAEGPPRPANALPTIILDRPPLASITHVKYYAEGAAVLSTLASTAYLVITDYKPGLLVFIDETSLPDLEDRPDAVQITYVAGAAAIESVPAGLRQAMLLVLSHFYENRQFLNIGNIVNELPISLRHLLETYRVGGWVG